MSQPPADIESELIDLTGVPLAELPSYDAAALAPTVRRLMRRVDDPDGGVSNYNPQRID